MSRSFRAFALSLAICAFAATTIWAQADTSVNGVVTDPTGALLPGAVIKLTNSDNGAERVTKSDGSGRYSFGQIQPGFYVIDAKAEGFFDVKIEKFRVLVGSPVTLDIHIQNLAKTSESVTISADAAQVNTQDATLGNAIGTKPIMELPFEARNVVGLLSIQPGVTFFGDPSDYRSGSVNGGKSDQGNVTLDGVDTNDQQKRSAFTSVLRTTLDSVQEFRTTTTNGGADAGRTSGAQVTLITKGGTNELHGSLYEYTRNTLTSANTFFNNESGTPRQKLIRNVFGGSLGGPIKKNRLFYFINYEGRRDASDYSVVRTVPTALFRQGIFTYQDVNGNQQQLNQAQLKLQDPTGQGVDPAVLKVLQSYPMPNDNTTGDGLNTAGYRFNSAVPLSFNTYIAKLDYQIDPAGKHMLFWRGNLQNDDFVPATSTAASELPGQPSASRHLENSKGFAVGYTWLATSNMVSSLRYGFTRQGYTDTGTQSSAVVSLRDIDDPFSTSKGVNAVIPVHDIEESVTYNKGAHTIQFGGSLRFINTKRLSYENSFSSAISNSSWFFDQGQGLVGDLAIDPNTQTAFTRQMSNILGFVDEGHGYYNYDKQGNLLPQGQGISRDFTDREYEMFLQDSWKVKKNFTVTAGLRVSLFPPLFEANGYQTSSNIPLGDWFNIRGGLAETGQSQALAPALTFNLASAKGGRGLYPFQKHFSPRIAFGYSPDGDTGVGRWLFGGPGKTSIRAGAGLFYDMFGQSLIQLADATSLGFSTQLTNPANAHYETSARYVGPTVLPANLLPPAPAGGFPQTAPNAFAIAQGLDSALQAPYSISLDFSFSRELSHGFMIQGNYVGRLSRKSLQADDVAAPTNLIDPKSGQSYFQAATAMQVYLRAHPNASGADVAGLKAIPFFEDLYSGYAGGGFTATQNLYQNYWQYGLNNDTGPLASIDDAPSNGCSPCSSLGPNAMFNSQYSSLAVWRTRGSGSYHAMQWTLRKHFSSGIQFDFNYTLSKSIDLGSYRESDTITNGQIINAWNTRQMKAVSDYDARHLISAFFVADLPYGHGRRYGNNVNPVVNFLFGGWGVSGIWRQSSGLPVGVGDGGQWATNWNLSGFAIATGPVAVHNNKNSTTGGPNIFADPNVAFNLFEPNFPGTTGGRNILRGYGLFNIDGAISKRFAMPYSERHTVQIRAEVFNVTNSAQFDVSTMNLDIGDSANFGKYTSTLGNPRVMQFAARYEF